MEIMPEAVTVEETTTTGEERDAMETDMGNKVQETEQELPPQTKYAQKKMTISGGKKIMTNVDYVGKKGHLAKKMCNCFSCERSTHIIRKCPWNKKKEQNNVTICSSN